MEFPKELLYTKDHEWARLENETHVVVGITEHAQSALGEIVYVELPKVGRELKAHETFGVVESIKAVSDLYSPVAGSVTQLNGAAQSDPSLINKYPYTDGWLIKVKLTNKESLAGLLSAQEYQRHVEGLK